MCNLLLRSKKPFLISAGYWEDPAFLERVTRQLRSAGMAYRMTHARVGKIGGDFEGMGDFRVPDGTFNMEIVNYTLRKSLVLKRQRVKWLWIKNGSSGMKASPPKATAVLSMLRLKCAAGWKKKDSTPLP
jgi:hypothetical protein